MAVRFICKAVLFDMDGTLVDSTRSVEAIWSQWAEHHGIEVDRILAVSHGRRTLDTLREVAPQLDIKAEAQRLEEQEIGWPDGVAQVPGAGALIASLPDDRWAVVTSASRRLAEARLRMAGLPIPRVLVCASDVARGKPDPEGYLLAADALGIAAADCLVIEDTPAGIRAGLAAGMQVLAITTTFPGTELLGAQSISHFTNVNVVLRDGAMHLHV